MTTTKFEKIIVTVRKHNRYNNGQSAAKTLSNPIIDYMSKVQRLSHMGVDETNHRKAKYDIFIKKML